MGHYREECSGCFQRARLDPTERDQWLSRSFPLETRLKQLQHSVVGRHFYNGILLFCPIILNGCCTYLTLSATHAYRHDSVARIERAHLCQDGRLVVFVDGARAESSKISHFTMTVSLPPKEDGVWVPQDGMQAGWRIPDSCAAETVPVTIGPSVVLPAYQSALGNKDKFPPIVGAKRILYLVRHFKPDKQTLFLYASGDDVCRRKIEIGFDGRDVQTPQNYPLLLFLPLTAAVDLATFPLQIYWLSKLGDRPINIALIKESSAQ